MVATGGQRGRGYESVRETPKIIRLRKKARSESFFSWTKKNSSIVRHAKKKKLVKGVFIQVFFTAAAVVFFVFFFGGGCINHSLFLPSEDGVLTRQWLVIHHPKNDLFII